MKKIIKSTRFKVYFSLFLLLIVIPALFLYATDPQDLPKTETLIPDDHQLKRFEYLEINDFITDWSQESVAVTATLTNNSYIYDLTNVEVRIVFSSDEEGVDIVNSVKRLIGTISSRDEYFFEEIFEREGNYQSVTLTIDSLELAEKN
jgi:hypothetical protein